VSGVNIELRLIAADGRDAVPLLLHRPANGAAKCPLMVCVHGYTRQPLDHLQAFAPAANAAGFALLLPLFRDSGPHRTYQQLVHPRRGTRSDLALLEAIDGIAKDHGLDATRVHLFGYSGGAQFVHRLALLHPQRVASLGIGAAGWYTWPDTVQAWPQGLADAPGTEGCAPDMPAFLRLPIALWVGERDDGPDAHLREDPELNSVQGTNRLERARRWAAAIREQAAQRDIEACVSLEVLPRAGHDFLACHRKAGLAERAMAHAVRAMGRGSPVSGLAALPLC
jgi:pimeloyl-ACP methyl ester carboxylesterase